MNKFIKKMMWLFPFFILFLASCTNSKPPTTELEYNQLKTIKLNEVKPFEINEQQDLVGFQFKVPKTGNYVVDYLVSNGEITEENPLSLIVEGRKIKALSLYQQTERGDFSYHLKKGRMLYFAPTRAENRLPIGSTGKIRIRPLESIHFDVPENQWKLTLKVGEVHQIAYTMVVPENFPSDQAIFTKGSQDQGIDLSSSGKITAKKVGNYQVTIKQPLDAPFVDSRGRKLKKYQPITIKVIEGEKEPEPELANTLILSGFYQAEAEKQEIILTWQDATKIAALSEEQQKLDEEPESKEPATFEVQISFDNKIFKWLSESDISLLLYQVSETTPEKLYFKVFQKENGIKINQSNVIEMKKEKVIGYQEVRKDTDGDGLSDDEEKILGTDPNKADTDGDGLSDYEEIYIFGTNPLKPDTDNNGINDGDEDFDQDGLTNLEELIHETDPFVEDTDGDGLSDGLEINEYQTDPLNPDTDGDGLEDGLEVEIGSNPLMAESQFSRELTADLSGFSDHRVIPTVQMDNLSGAQAQSLIVRPVGLGHSFITPEIPGYIGMAFDFYVSGEFSQAQVSFEFVESLRERSNFSPTLYYYNQGEQLLEEVPNQRIDGNTVKAELSHFSTYILLNKTEYDKVWRTDILRPSESADGGVDLVFVVDESVSMRSNDPTNIRSEVIRQFVKKIRPQDRVGIVGFDSTARIYTALTSEKEQIEQAIKQISVRGWTNGSLGMKTGLDLFNQENAKRLIFLTDGADNSSSYDYQDLIEQANQQGIMIHTVGLGRSVDSKTLERIALETQGKYFFADQAEGLFEEYDEIEQETEKLKIDRNQDGLLDYYAEELFNGNLRFGNGQTLHDYFNLDPKKVTFEAFQRNNDYDSDGLLNGEELEVTSVKSQDRTRVYVKAHTSPFDKSTSGDGGSDVNGKAWVLGTRDFAIFSSLSYVWQEHWAKQYDIKTGEPRLLYDGGTRKSKGEFRLFSKFADSLEVRANNRWIRDEKLAIDGKMTNSESADPFSASTYVNQNDQQIVIVYQGSQEWDDWKNNGIWSLTGRHSNEQQARNYAKKATMAYPGYEIYLTGHSLGGYLALIGTDELSHIAAGGPIKKTVVFNALGVSKNQNLFGYKRKKLIKFMKEYEKSGRMESHRVSWDAASKIGFQYGTDRPDVPINSNVSAWWSLMRPHNMGHFVAYYAQNNRIPADYFTKYSNYKTEEEVPN